MHLSMRSAHHQLGLGLNGHSRQGGNGVINSFVNKDENQSTYLDTSLYQGWEITI